MLSTQGRVGVAISTTGDPHRLSLLAQSVNHWDVMLPEGSSLFVTVDGDERACKRVFNTVSHWTRSIYQVGEPLITSNALAREGRLGVAANKNTGLELLMDVGYHDNIQHLFLSDDDTWPLRQDSLELHAGLGRAGHSMVNWGAHRYGPRGWTWPRGAVLYANRIVVDAVGGMIEEFGPGGHEHVEWSRRIHQRGLSSMLFPSPRAYAYSGAMGARQFWHAEDMPKRGENRVATLARRKALTSVRREPGDWVRIEQIMAERDGNTAFVPYAANENQRSSATLYENH